MLAVMGDVHGHFSEMARRIAELPDEVELVIQIGDLGLWPEGPPYRAPRWVVPTKPVRYIRGNHDYEPWLVDLEVPTEQRVNLTFVPSGWIEELDGRLIGFLGGADSVIDREWRTEDVDWWPSERVTFEQLDRVTALGKLDLLITHTPPASVVRAMWGFEPCISARLVEKAWEETGYPPLVCGHMHKHLVYDQVRVLDILEVTLI